MKRKKRSTWQKSKILWLTLLMSITLGSALYFVFLHTPPISALPHSRQESLAVSKDELKQDNFFRSLETTPGKRDNEKIDPDKPLVAIVIDDMGYRKLTGDKMLGLNLNLSFAFLPFAPHTADQSTIAQHLGRDILLHLPMEPSDQKWEPGPGVLLLVMNQTQLHETFRKNLAAVPMAIGINNHMGSRFTEDQTAMKYFLQLVGTNNLFFLDSLTSSNSVGYPLAKEMGVQAIRRNIFLDNETQKDKIISQLEALIEVAEKRGFAVGIAHPHQETLTALTEFEDTLKERVNVVGIHTLVKWNE